MLVRNDCRIWTSSSNIHSYIVEHPGTLCRNRWVEVVTIVCVHRDLTSFPRRGRSAPNLPSPSGEYGRCTVLCCTDHRQFRATLSIPSAPITICLAIADGCIQRTFSDVSVPLGTYASAPLHRVVLLYLSIYLARKACAR